MPKIALKYGELFTIQTIFARMVNQSCKNAYDIVI